MRKRFAIALRVSALGLALSATTSTYAATKKPKPPETAPKAQRMDFDDDVVDGTLTAPDGMLVDPNRRVRHGSLIVPRLTFVPELIKSAEDL